ncbi:MAG: aminotransferase class III-fold pyridoxal phosphate-dependent enzyme [Acidimicrobiales bacterium]|nr:aminotransferase class III-fold pyridoxal phosphate-dependent enzyme [Acidimicrobiales bacterium]
MPDVDRSRLAALLEVERTAYAEARPRSQELAAAAAEHLVGGVPMTWMAKWAGGFPLYLAEAHGSRITDVDGHTYVDFALGDTGAMAGHSPAPTIAAVQRQVAEIGGITAMLPTPDAAWVAGELTRRFGLPHWSFALSATDANRWALRLARLVTGRPLVACFSYSYHGTVDETFAVRAADGSTVARAGNVAPAVDPAVTTRAMEWNDLATVEAALADERVAVLITEPALTNIGIVLPEPGFLEGVREICDRTGTLLLIDETHTLSAGPGGCTRAWGLRPDIVTLGKSFAGGIPIGAYGLSPAVAHRLHDEVVDGDADIVDVGGVGGTLAGNALSLAAARATLGEVLTDEAFVEMIELATRFTAGVQATLDRHDLPWTVAQLGARSEYRFARPAPRTGTASAAAHDDDLEEYLHLAMANRGILLTPFHNMALMAPSTEAGDVDRHTTAFAEVVAAIC